MALDTAPAPVAPPPPLGGGSHPPGARADTVFRWLSLAGGGLVLVILALVVYSTTRQAWPALRKEGLDFVLSDDWDVVKGQFGALAFIFGTLVISVIALLLALPVSIGIALFITEVAPRRLQRPVVYVIDLLAVIPSVVFGLWGILVLAPAILGFYQNVADAVSGVPVLGNVLNGTPVVGRSFMTAGIILAIMITPIITSITREVFATVPRSQKEAALALGATRWEMIRGAVFPHSRSGMVAGAMIGFGRAMGETIAVALVIGSIPTTKLQLFGSGDSMAAVIANNFGDASGTFRSALIGLGVVLFGMTLVIGTVAQALVGRAERRLGAVAR